MKTKTRHVSLLLACLTFASACGGGSDAITPTPPPPVTTLTWDQGNWDEVDWQ